MGEKRKKSNDIILIAALLTLAAAAFIFVRIIKPGFSKAANSELILEISEDNAVLFSTKLGEIKLPFSYEVESSDGGHNTFTAEKLEDGSIGISCTEADCPDKVCVETGIIKLSDDVIVCLPHKVVARLYTPAN